MKFLLIAINAKYIHSNPAIYSLRAYAGERRQFVELAEYTINQPMGEILADIYHRRPDVIGFSCYIWNWRLVQDLLAEIPKLLPEARLWLGGPEVTYDADVILGKFPWLTGIMVGEGEETFRELLEHYVTYEKPETMGNHEERLRKIPGLCLSSGYTPHRPMMDMNKIPFLYEDLTAFENRILYYESSRGCPFGCSYCLSSLEKSVRIRDISVVKRELQFFLDNRVRQVKFVDRTFNCNHSHAMEIWKYIHEHDNGVTNFHFEISADILQQDEIALLGKMRPGLVQLEIGVQSANPKALGAIRRRSDLDILEKAVADIGKGGNIHRHLDLIAGLPYEDYESFGKSFDRVCRMKPDQLQLGFLKVLKGSEMWEKAHEFGILYLEQPPYEVLCTKWISYEEMLRLKRIEEMVEIYHNSLQFTHTMPFLERAFPGPFAMYEALADYYEKKGYFASSPARAYRYGILLDFAAERDGIRLAAYKELLTYDMYLRENLKSRPEFAPDLKKYKDVMNGFYKREAEERRFLDGYGGCDWKQIGRMTHLEPFVHPVWNISEMLDRYGECGGGKPAGPLRFVLFDYQKRNPLNYEAAAQPVF